MLILCPCNRPGCLRRDRVPPAAILTSTGAGSRYAHRRVVKRYCHCSRNTLLRFLIYSLTVSELSVGLSGCQRYLSPCRQADRCQRELRQRDFSSCVNDKLAVFSCLNLLRCPSSPSFYFHQINSFRFIDSGSLLARYPLFTTPLLVHPETQSKVQCWPSTLSHLP